MKPSVLLAKAKKVIETKGWCQGEYHKEGDGYCLYGALFKAGKVEPDSEYGEKLAESVVPFLEHAVPEARSDVLYKAKMVSWNDTEGRTKKQVLAAFDKAIVLAKEAGE